MPHITDDELLGWQETDQTQREMIAELRADAEVSFKRIIDLEAALRPFANAVVFNDNYDITITTIHIGTGDYLRAKRLLRNE